MSHEVENPILSTYLTLPSVEKMLKKFLPTSKQGKEEPECRGEDEEESQHGQGFKRSRNISIKKRLSIVRQKNGKDKNEDKKAAASSLEDGITQPDLDLEIIEMTDREKKILKDSWKIVYNELGCSLCYVGSNTGYESSSSPFKEDRSIVDEAFIRMFEEYPSSQEFFIQFRGSPIEEIKNDARLLRILKEHGLRVFQLVEKVMGRLEDLKKGSKLNISQ